MCTSMSEMTNDAAAPGPAWLALALALALACCGLGSLLCLHLVASLALDLTLFCLCIWPCCLLWLWAIDPSVPSRCEQVRAQPGLHASAYRHGHRAPTAVQELFSSGHAAA